MKILITGGAGFIGSALADRLCLLNHQVLVIDNFETGNNLNVSEQPNLKLVQGSITDSKLMHQVFSEFLPDQVVHAAASYKDPNNWMKDVHTNIEGTINLIDVAQKYKVKKIIYLQTSLCYGLNPSEKPITLNYALFGGKFDAGSSYALSKTSAELYLKLSEIPLLIFRLSNIYGPRNLSGPIPTFYQRLTNKQKCILVNSKRDFLFIDDLVSLLILAIQNPDITGTYHAGSGSEYSVPEIFNFIKSALNIENFEIEEKEPNADDTSFISLDISKTKKDFNWMAEMDIHQGINVTVNWYKNHKISENYTHLKNIY
ncbi:MAG: NAD-dependent epimerase/dehydratase family protein [Sphingobacteriaceae bacterium]|nr:NAD-dependent epimerase/dehydratase family protein [Sphingobacteriaceae bacterium]